MAWDIAAYAIALSFLVSAGAVMFVLLRVYRSFRRWDRMAVRIVLKADNAIDECVLTAREARDTAELCRSILSGFAGLADAARTVGEIAESASQAAANLASLWRDRKMPQPSDIPGDEGFGFDWAGFGRYLGLYFRKRIIGDERESSGFRPGKNADPYEGE